MFPLCDYRTNCHFMLANFKKYMITIFLTEDDKDDQNIFKEALDEIEISFLIANFHNGEELLEHLDNNQDLLPDIIFLDLNMPKLNGMDCLKILRKNPKYADLFVAIYSTSGAKENIENAFLNGANAYIKKPGNFNELKSILKELLSDTVGDHFAASNLKTF